MITSITIGGTGLTEVGAASGSTEDGPAPVVVSSQLPDNENTSVTNMAECRAAEVIEQHGLPTPLMWIEHYPD